MVGVIPHFIGGERVAQSGGRVSAVFDPATGEQSGVRRTGNLRAAQLLLGHTKIESTVRYLGIEVDDALAIAEQVDV